MARHPSQGQSWWRPRKPAYAQAATPGRVDVPGTVLRVRHGRAPAAAERQRPADTGLTRTKYSSLERGEVASLSPEDAARLAKVLGVDPDEVLTAHAAARSSYLEG
jgi:transcriptional regulator with XRE-family HTH domain